MKIIFYGNILKDNIEDVDIANREKQRIINEFLPLGMSIFRITRELKLPRAIIKNFPETLDKNTDLYLNLNRLTDYFGDCLERIDYIPISGDLQLHVNGEGLFLSNILLAVSCNMGDIKIE